MLWSPAHGFLWSVDNFGGTYTTAAFGTAVSQHVNAHTKGADVELLGDIAEDAYGISIHFAANNAAGALRTYLTDIKVDPAGGTTYATVIPNLLHMAAGAPNGFQNYYFPLYIPKGGSIAAASQCNVGNATANSIPRVGVRVYGKPRRPELVKAGSFVRAFGPNTGTSAGASITPGTSAMGSYTASLGTMADDLWWWQCGFSCSDTTMTALAYWLDVALGDASNKVLGLQHCQVRTDAAEHASKDAFGQVSPMVPIASGADVFMRAACSAAPDTGVSIAAYGLGG